jgi:hypothetical protein
LTSHRFCPLQIEFGMTMNRTPKKINIFRVEISMATIYFFAHLIGFKTGNERYLIKFWEIEFLHENMESTFSITVCRIEVRYRCLS